jgi:hypothetical protein
VVKISIFFSKGPLRLPFAAFALKKSVEGGHALASEVNFLKNFATQNFYLALQTESQRCHSSVGRATD